MCVIVFNFWRSLREVEAAESYGETRPNCWKMPNEIGLEDKIGKALIVHKIWLNFIGSFVIFVAIRGISDQNK